jgi:hypothetical protein
MPNNTLTYPGQVSFEYLKLISSQGIVVDLNDYLVEINIFEDIFANFLHGQVMVSDSRNLIAKMPIIGNEYLLVKFETPTLGVPIEKVFRVYSIDNVVSSRDNNTKTYILNFVSIEAFNDAVISVFKPYNGLISDVAGEIFTEFLESPARPKFEENNITLDETDTIPLYVEPTKNKIKFISPGWTPAMCINWLASKAIPGDGGSPDYLFWETTSKGFAFTSIERLTKNYLEAGLVDGNYYYAPPGALNTEDIIEKLFLVESFEVVRFIDNLRNYQNGYFGSGLGTFDLYKKTYTLHDYNHVENYNTFTHLGGDSAIAPFSPQTPTNSDQNIKFYPVNSKLFSGTRENYSEVMPNIYGKRLSRLNELNNFKVNITVPGRTDMFAGAIINFLMPDTTVKNEITEDARDPVLSGVYLVSAIRHKINFRTHMMVMELVKDSIELKRQ